MSAYLYAAETYFSQAWDHDGWYFLLLWASGEDA